MWAELQFLYNRHFTCAVLIQGKWTYIDDPCLGVEEFTNLAALNNKMTYILFSCLTVEKWKNIKVHKRDKKWGVIPSHFADFFLFCK